MAEKRSRELGKWTMSQGSANRALWDRITKKQDYSNGPLACPFARSIAPLAHLLAPPYSLGSRAPLRSLVRSLAHFDHSQVRETVNDSKVIFSVFFFLFWTTVTCWYPVYEKNQLFHPTLVNVNMNMKKFLLQNTT